MVKCKKNRWHYGWFSSPSKCINT